MKYRKFGRTVLEVSAAVFGGGRVGGIPAKLQTLYATDPGRRA